jgi:hypothetical protein
MGFLSEQYVINKFYQFAGLPKYNRSQKTYQGCCPICREGKSWLIKRRLYYIPKTDKIFCHNCGWSGGSYKWVKELTGLTHKEIVADSLEFDTVDVNAAVKVVERAVQPSLPGDCINLFDQQQIQYYKSDKEVSAAVKYIHNRRLDSAINKPQSLYYCRDEFVHNKRIVIPYFDANNKIIFYQSRFLLNNENTTRYMSKVGSERSLFNINQISADATEVFMFEGPFNAFFVQNSAAVGGIQENSRLLYSHKQQSQIDLISKFKRIIWVLDSQWIDEASRKKSKILIEEKQEVFIWPENIGKKYKDFNDICKALNIDSIDRKFILSNTYSGIEAILKLGSIK